MGVLSAWLVGSNSLVVECAVALAERGHRVCGVVSAASGVRRQAAERGLRAEPFGSLGRVIAESPFDLLFSVANLRMLPVEVIEAPGRMAVNFHDALLPRDAGVNASAWAVAAGAVEHGVTWHVMTGEADTGDVLVQWAFPVAPDETSRSLNEKCWTAALESFCDLVDELAAGTERRTPQNLAERTYHGRLDRPGLALSWRRPAAELEALVRATDFGTAPNRFGLCRVLTPDGWHTVTRSALRPEPSGAEPGTVVARSEHAFAVATAVGDLLLEPVPDGVRLGDRLPEPGPDAAEAVRAGLTDEPFWRKRLGELRPLRGLCGRGEAVTVAVPGTADELVEPVLAYLAALAGEECDIGLRRPAHGLLAETIPVRQGQTVRSPYLRDLPLRQPGLVEPDLPVVVEIGAEGPAAELLIRLEDGSATWFTDNPALAEGFAAFTRSAAGNDRAPLVSPQEATRQAAANETNAPYPDQRVDELFLAQARTRPDATAVVFGHERLTYRDLDERSARFAAHLIERGAVPGTRVAVYLERSVDLLVALLAVMRTGAAYVPVDPVYPAARIAYMLDDAQAALIVTQASLAHNVADVPIVLVGRDLPSAGGLPAAAGDLAYVIYTSGSTGRPKGVEVSHRGLTNFLCSMAGTPGFAASDTMLAITTVCFDIAGLELFLPLITGGTVEIAPGGVVGDGTALRAMLERGGPTVLQATPVTWRMLLDAGWTGDPGLKALCGGEALPADLAVALLDRVGELWNLYGPTETTIWSTVSRVRPGEPITIGRPIANTACHVLDRHLRTVPTGIAGELYIGGDGLAAGYRERPELTAERFVPTEFGRLYRTGDLARRRPDGSLDCLGRTDHQIKLHGHRIEPGEIEAVLRERARDAVVVVRDERLVGYVAPTGLDLAMLRERLRSRLPGYMVPSELIELDALPETPNGKIDRNALPAPTGPNAAPTRPERLDTLLDLIEAICAHATDLVGAVEPVEADQRFADAGIDSLAAAALLARLHTATGTRLTVSATFQHPTPRALATHLHHVRTGTTIATERPDLDSIRLDASIVPGRLRGGDACLVTGATGFVGAFVARDLAAQGRRVHCLVRASDDAEATRRLRDTLTAYEIWSDELEPLLQAHAGDLTRPLLGLPETLCTELGDIYHCGAHVSAVHPYEALKDANVSGTQEALRLASLSGAFMHHVSTIEVFAQPPFHGGPISADDPAGPSTLLRGGYAQTKYAAELLVAQAHNRGLRTAIYRLPRILGDTRTGACQTRDLLWQILKGCVQAHAVPTGLTASYDLAPVDHVARAITAATSRPGLVAHLTNPQRVSFDTLTAHLEGYGYDLDPLPLAAWTGRIRAQPANPASPVLDIFLEEMTGTGWSTLAFAPTTPCPPITQSLLTIYLDYFTRTGYLPKPT